MAIATCRRGYCSEDGLKLLSHSPSTKEFSMSRGVAFSLKCWKPLVLPVPSEQILDARQSFFFSFFSFWSLLLLFFFLWVAPPVYKQTTGHQQSLNIRALTTCTFFLAPGSDRERAATKPRSPQGLRYHGLPTHMVSWRLSGSLPATRPRSLTSGPSSLEPGSLLLMSRIWTPTEWWLQARYLVVTLKESATWPKIKPLLSVDHGLQGPGASVPSSSPTRHS